jgi:hypothetical protein
MIELLAGGAGSVTEWRVKGCDVEIQWPGRAAGVRQCGVLRQRRVM